MHSTEEALLRARTIWGGGALVTELYRNGSADVRVGTHTHFLSTEGHATCHSRCEDLEAEALAEEEAELGDELRRLVAEALEIFEQSALRETPTVANWATRARAVLEKTRPA